MRRTVLQPARHERCSTSFYHSQQRTQQIVHSHLLRMSNICPWELIFFCGRESLQLSRQWRTFWDATRREQATPTLHRRAQDVLVYLRLQWHRRLQKPRIQRQAAAHPGFYSYSPARSLLFCCTKKAIPTGTCAARLSQHAPDLLTN